MDRDSQRFWDRHFQGCDPEDEGYRALRDFEADALARAREHFGSLAGKRLLDLGCGVGTATAYFAAMGAGEVLAVDRSAVALDRVRQLCRRHGLDNVRTVRCDAMEIARLAPVDLVYGSLILHHIEPFQRFCRELRRTVVPGGKGFFFENNGRSRAMLWCRRHLVGRFWVPKYGDDEEHPLTPDEVKMLQRYFRVRVAYPEVLLFRMLSFYLLRGLGFTFAGRLDGLAYRWPWLRRYSYRQVLYLEGEEGEPCTW